MSSQLEEVLHIACDETDKVVSKQLGSELKVESTLSNFIKENESQQLESPIKNDQIIDHNEEEQVFHEQEEKTAQLSDEYFGKKKKKSKLKLDDEEAIGDNIRDTERDILYYELLDRIYEKMIENNIEFYNHAYLSMKAPKVVRVGTKRTAIANFAEICKILDRGKYHLLKFFTVELSTTASLAMNKELIIKGRFEQKHIQKVLKKFIRNNLFIYFFLFFFLFNEPYI